MLASGGPRHKFWERVIDLGIEKALILFSEGKLGSAWSVSDVLWACGLDVVATAYNEQFAGVLSVSLIPKLKPTHVIPRSVSLPGENNSSKSRQSRCGTWLCGVAAPSIFGLRHLMRLPTSGRDCRQARTAWHAALSLHLLS